MVKGGNIQPLPESQSTPRQRGCVPTFGSHESVRFTFSLFEGRLATSSLNCSIVVPVLVTMIIGVCVAVAVHVVEVVELDIEGVPVGGKCGCLGRRTGT